MILKILRFTLGPISLVQALFYFINMHLINRVRKLVHYTFITLCNCTNYQLCIVINIFSYQHIIFCCYFCYLFSSKYFMVNQIFISEPVFGNCNCDTSTIYGF